MPFLPCKGEEIEIKRKKWIISIAPQKTFLPLGQADIVPRSKAWNIKQEVARDLRNMMRLISRTYLGKGPT